VDNRATSGHTFRPPVVRSEGRIRSGLMHCAHNGWTVAVEHQTADDFAESFWQPWRIPVCEGPTGTHALNDLCACCQAYPDHFVRFSAYEGDAAGGVIKLRMLVQAPGDDACDWSGHLGSATNTEVEASIYNGVRRLLRGSDDFLSLTLQDDLNALQITLSRSFWQCEDRQAGQCWVTWSNFMRPEPVALHAPVRCRQELTHHSAGSLVGRVLAQLRERLGHPRG